MTQITVLSGVERRRHWSNESKLTLVEAAIVLGASVAAIARDAAVSPSSIYRWRRNLCSKLTQPTGFAGVAVRADPPEIDRGGSDMLVIELRGVTRDGGEGAFAGSADAETFDVVPHIETLTPENHHEARPRKGL